MFQIIRRWREPYDAFFKMETVGKYDTLEEAKAALDGKFAKMLEEDEGHRESYQRSAYGAGFEAYYCQEYFIIKSD